MKKEIIIRGRTLTQDPDGKATGELEIDIVDVMAEDEATAMLFGAYQQRAIDFLSTHKTCKDCPAYTFHSRILKAIEQITNDMENGN